MKCNTYSNVFRLTNFSYIRRAVYKIRLLIGRRYNYSLLISAVDTMM